MFKRFRDMLLGVFIGGFMVTAIISAFASESGSEWSRLLPFTQHNLMTMRQVRNNIEAFFVDEDKLPGERKLFHGSLKGIVAAVDDPYTRFIDPEQLREEGMEMEGEYGGLGMYIGTRDGKILVISPIEDTPAFRAGVKPLDEIVKVDDEVVVGMDQNDVVKRLRGEPDTDVTVWMRRSGEDELKSFDMTREIINIKTVRSEMMDNIAYIKLNSFHQKSAMELSDAIDAAESQDAGGIILDVRNNPGGLLNIAVDVASLFIDGKLVVSLKGRIERIGDELYAERGLATDLPVVVLINEGSASASEIVAGAIQDHDRGTLVGTKSYGKGSVQSLFPLPERAGMYITIARYATPSGAIIDHKGLSPDHFVEGEPNQVTSEDKQLQRALEVMREILHEIPENNDAKSARYSHP
ncbi:MAG: S41 family peptidase [Synergistaceae bacterium]|jgi:carboxyl-terminal processing protease|nr:S41 family peptidase [Synergistaceae bacterium]